MREAALRILARREHSRAELTLKLRARSYSESLIESTLQDLKDEGLQCDERAAELYVRQRVAKGYGALKIRAELNAKGVASEVVSSCIERADVDWLELASRVAERKSPPIDRDDKKALLKQQRFLAGRGFTTDVIRRVLAPRKEY